jgi:hypothetical protein
MLQRWGSFGAYAAKAKAKQKSYVCTLEAAGLFKGKRSFVVSAFHWEGRDQGVGAGGVGRGNRESEEKEEKRVEFSVVKNLDELSHHLFEAAARGIPIETLELVGPEGKFVFRFKDVFVTAVVSGGSAFGGTPEEQVRFEAILDSMTFQPSD